MRKAAQVTCFLSGPWSSCIALTKHCHSHCSRGHTQEAQSNEAACQGDADSGSGLLPSGLFSRLRCYDSVCPGRGDFLCVSSASPSFSLALTLALSLCLSSFVCFLFLFPFVFSLATFSHCPSSLRVIPSTPHMSLVLMHLSLPPDSLPSLCSWREETLSTGKWLLGSLTAVLTTWHPQSPIQWFGAGIVDPLRRWRP